MKTMDEIKQLKADLLAGKDTLQMFRKGHDHRPSIIVEAEKK